MTNNTRKLETLVNVAIVVVAVAVCAVLAKQYLLTGAQGRSRGPEVGSKIELAGTDLSKEEKTLLLVLQKGCHFCTDSGPFYQRLAREAAARGNRVKLLAVLPQNEDEGRRYLSDLGVPIERVAQASLGKLDVSGTPTLILLDRGKVSDVWVGKLPDESEAEVLSKL
jgi:thioredoxin-related protein